MTANTSNVYRFDINKLFISLEKEFLQSEKGLWKNSVLLFEKHWMESLEVQTKDYQTDNSYQMNAYPRTVAQEREKDAMEI